MYLSDFKKMPIKTKQFPLNWSALWPTAMTMGVVEPQVVPYSEFGSISTASHNILIRCSIQTTTYFLQNFSFWIRQHGHHATIMLHSKCYPLLVGKGINLFSMILWHLVVWKQEPFRYYYKTLLLISLKVT